MTTIDALKSLQKRVREATGPDRELDAGIAAVFFGGEAYHAPAGYDGYRWVRLVKDDGCTCGVEFDVERYTTNPDGLGACVALMREVLQGCEWSKAAMGNFWIHVDLRTITSRRVGGGCLVNDCLSFLDAIIAAKIAELESKEVV